MIKIFLLSALLFLNCPRIGLAQTHFVHSHSGTSSSQLAVWAAKDLNLFAKYRLDVDLVFISGGARGMQALIGGSTQSADSDGVAPHFMRSSVEGMLSSWRVSTTRRFLNLSPKKK